MEKSSINNFFEKIIGDETSLTRFLAALRGGKNEVLHNQISQNIVLDDSWIIRIEDALYSMEQIVRNPRKFIAEYSLIVDVAKARRTNTKTVRHLASHSQFVESIEKNGDVRPKKLLVTESDEDLAIYENRFICALVNRLTQFVEQRHRDLIGKLDVSRKTNVGFKTEFNYGANKFACDIQMKVEEPPEDSSLNSVNQGLFDRVEVIRRRLRVLQSTEFVTKLSKQKPVRPPIQKTNLLMKNVDYNNCYKLWIYLSSFTYLGYSIEVQDKYLPVDGDYYDDLTVIAGLSIQSLLSDQILNRQKYAQIEFNEPETRDYTLVTNYSFQPDFDDSKMQAGEESVNEYYFRKLKDELIKITAEDEVAVEKQLDMNFNKFFRAVARINDEMMTDIIEQQISDREELKGKNALQKKQILIRQQKERLRRRAQLTKLKWEELERAQRVQDRAQAKLEKLKSELAQERAKVAKVRNKSVTKTTLTDAKAREKDPRN